MARKGSGFGFVIVLVVLVVVTMLAARLWNETAPTLNQVMQNSPASSSATENSSTSENAAFGELPNLNGMRSATDEHTQDVNEAIAATE